MSIRTTIPTLVVLAAVGVAACGTSAATGAPGSGAPGSDGSASPAPGAIVHPTGPNDIVLRFDEAGGFVPPEFLAAHVPYFTLYGDGTVVFVRTTATTQPAANGPSTGLPVRTAKLTEAQVQGLLTFALSEGGLAIARERYDNPLVADAPTAIFEIHAAGDAKTVSVMALGLDAQPGPDSAIKAALARLGDRLRDFDQGGTLESSPYQPAAYRGVLLEASGIQGVNIAGWPWPSLAPADFKLPADPNVLQQRTRALTPEQAAATGVTGFENGIQAGLWYRGPDGLVYSFVLRPLLPDEAA